VGEKQVSVRAVFDAYVQLDCAACGVHHKETLISCTVPRTIHIGCDTCKTLFGRLEITTTEIGGDIVVTSFTAPGVFRLLPIKGNLFLTRIS
jgi:transcription elongation factor Elf1